MSEPIHTEGRAKEQNVSPYLIEMPINPVGIKLVPHHFATAEGGLGKTGKLEVRFDGSTLPTRNDKRKTIEWQKVAYNAAQQAAYYRQVHDNLTARAEEYERKYTTALRDYQAMKTLQEDGVTAAARLRPLVDAALRLKNWWGFSLLPKSFKKLVGTA